MTDGSDDARRRRPDPRGAGCDATGRAGPHGDADGAAARANGGRPEHPVGSADPETNARPGRSTGSGLARREFLKRTGLGAGALAAGAGSLPALLSSCGTTVPEGPPDVAVIGAGAFGVWTAYYLRQRGANVVLVDQYGPGNSRATSGGETRGVRTSYGHRSTGELWTRWDGRAVERWNAFDAEWREDIGIRHFFTTGDLIMREDWDPMTTGSREMWDRLGVSYEALDRDEIAYRWPWIDLEGITVGLYEPRAGVVRARRVCETVAEMFMRDGGRIQLARADLGRTAGDRLDEIRLTPGEPLRAGSYVFALGPWFPTFFPELMGEMIRTPIGNVCYYGTPPGDNRFTYPNMPSYNFPGVTGWPCLPPDNRGFRVRTGGHESDPSPDRSVRWFGEDSFERPLAVLERFPALIGAPLLETRSCHYELSVTRNWLIDHHPDYSNVWIAGGGSAEAFKFGPVLGEYIAGRVLDDDPYPELAEQFRLPDLSQVPVA